MKLLLKFLKPHLASVITLMVLYAAQTFCALFMPYVMSNIVEYGIRLSDMDYIWKQGAVMAALALAALICALVTNKINCSFIAKLTVGIRKEVFNKVNALSFEQFSGIGTGSLITRTTDDISWMEETISMIPYVLVAEPIMFFGGILLAFMGDWMLSVILLGVSLVVLVIVSLITRRLEGYWQRGDEYTDVQNRVIRERLSGIRVIRAFDKESHEHKRAEHSTTEMCKCFVRSNTISGLVNPLASVILNLATVGVIYVGAVRLQSVETLRAGDIIATIQYIALIVNAILTVSWTFAFIPHVKVSMRRIGEVLDMPIGEKSGFALARTQPLKGNITFRGVSFAYPGSEAEALSDINLDIEAGEIVGVIGGTGSGKTTLIKLIMDFYSGVGGERYIGGENYIQLDSSTVRDNISVALQKSMIFQGTIEENVKMGNKDASDEEMRRALEISQLAEFTDSHTEGTKYALKQAGSNISGGQKQRVNIARAILKPASVYIFDDSFSALDYLTESKLRKALNVYLEGKTQIIVTQRAATAMRCDKVYVLDRGRIVGCGDHRKLMRECGIYREIYNSQLGGGELE